MNVLESVTSAATLAIDWGLWGFRLSSVLFALITFVAITAGARRLVAQARADGVGLPFPPGAVLVAAVLLLLVDFGFLLAGRVVEATVARIALLAVLLWLVSRGTFLGPRHDGWRRLRSRDGRLADLRYGYNAFWSAIVWSPPRGGSTAGPGRLRHAAIAGPLRPWRGDGCVCVIVCGDSPLRVVPALGRGLPGDGQADAISSDAQDLFRAPAP
jgi:hypothetical protein